MKYLKISGRVVSDILYDNDPVFPGVPVDKRYPAAYVNSLTAVEDDVAVAVGQVLNDDGEWVYPDPPSPDEMPEPEPMPEAAPSQLDIIEAQITYTAMMTDTLLEG